MADASKYVASGDIAVATRSVVLDGVAVEEGQIIGVADGRLCVANADINGVLEKVLEEMEMADRELVSLYYGQEVDEADAQVVANKVQELYPEVEIELLAGGQSIYQYILGAE
jgi:dihydroxyacetone kinase-like predicted kinase